jgi:UDP-glucose 4-epimerase
MKTIIITGGTGFLGRNLALKLQKKYNVILAGRNNHWANEARRLTGCLVYPMDITNIDSVRDCIGLYKPEIIIHAAGTKYVDLGELYPNECVDVNIRGSQNIARVAIEYGVKLVMGISTDKAAPPCKSLYGTSKSVMEKLFLLLNGQYETHFFCLRFGNIAWSTDSVLPIWKSMLESKGKIITTGSDMRRFFFTVHDACKMIIDSLENQELLYSKILAKKMKSALIGNVLSRFILAYGGSFEKNAPRIGESIDEIMIGESETIHAKEVLFGNAQYYLIDYTSSNKEIVTAIDTNNAEKFRDEEIDLLIKPSTESFI